MTKKITDIPFWSLFFECFPEKENIVIQQDETAITNEEWLAIARWWRNALLSESDWSQVSDNSLNEIQRESWRKYRQDLRNITDTYANPKDIVFPDLPS
jgi:hypothetical protein